MWLAYLRRLPFLAALLMLATAAGFLMMLVYLVFGVARWTVVPFPTYGHTLRGTSGWVFAGFGALWGATIVVDAIFGRLNESVPRIIGQMFVALFGCLCWVSMGTDAVNGLFDFGPRTPTEVVLEGFTSSTTTSSRGQSTSHAAEVSRVDHPGESVSISWPGCHLPKGVERSPHFTMMMGRGALGGLWYEPKIICYPLRVGERPIYEKFFVGRGRPLALITLVSFSAEQGEVKLVAPWVRALRQRVPDLEIAVVHVGPAASIPLVARLECPDCRALTEEDIDEPIARVATGDDPFEGRERRIFVTDRQGRPLFNANLEDRARIPELTALLTSPQGP